MPSKILMLLNAPYPSDMRVRKEAGSLIEAGIEVFLLCAREKGQAYAETFDGIRIVRIDVGKTKSQFAFWDVVMSISFVHPLFKKAIKKLLVEEKINVIHVHDLPLTGTALKLKKEYNLTVIADLHENYPEAMALWFGWKKNIIVRLKNYWFMNQQRWAMWEKKAVTECDKIISIVDEQKSFLLQKYPYLADEKILVISNTELTSFHDQPVDPTIYREYPGKFIVCYTGGLGAVRGVDTIIRSMASLKAYPDIIFVVVGTGSPDFMLALRTIIKECQVEDKVFLLGYQNFSKVFSYMNKADVNVIPHQKNAQSEYGVPHKLFQNMMAGKPVLVSDCGPIQRIVQTTQSGLTFKAGDPKDAAEKIIQLYSNREEATVFGKNGEKATLQGSLNWERTAIELVSLYRKIFQSY